MTTIFLVEPDQVAFDNRDDAVNYIRLRFIGFNGSCPRGINYNDIGDRCQHGEAVVKTIFTSGTNMISVKPIVLRDAACEQERLVNLSMSELLTELKIHDETAPRGQTSDIERSKQLLALLGVRLKEKHEES